MVKRRESSVGGTIRAKELDMYTTDQDTVITPENVKYLGENIAIYSLKRLFAYHGMVAADVYYGLIKDIHLVRQYERPISDGYDYAQEAICFLTGHMGKRLGDQVMGRQNKPVNLFHACSSTVGNYFYRQYAFMNHTAPIGRKDQTRTIEPFEQTDA